MNKKNVCLALALWAAQAFAQTAPEAAAFPAPAAEPTWNDLLAARQHTDLDARLGTALEAGLTDLTRYRVARRALAELVQSMPQTSDRFDAWVAATNSGTAHLARAEFHLRRAWQARGTETFAKTHPDALVRMRQLLAAARSDYETALEKIGPRCDLCHAGLLEVRLPLGERQPVAAMVDQAVQALDGGIATPRAYVRFLEPRWGGNAAEAQRFVERFAADGPARAAIPLLRSALLVERSDQLNRQHKPEQALVMSQQAVIVDPGNSRAWERVAADALDLNLLPLALEATERALALDPGLRYALNARASALLKGPTPVEAVPFLERAVAQGDEWALKALLPIVAAGQHGFKPDPVRAEKICQSAIDALMPAGFACMGGLEYFGIGRPADRRRALQWFLEASDRGVNVAMVDAALMLLRGDGAQRDEKRAMALLVKAHFSGEPRAEGHLRAQLSTPAYWQHVYWPEYQAKALGALQDQRSQTRLMIAIGCMLAGSLFWGFMYRAGDRPAHRIGQQRHLRPGWLLRVSSLFNLLVVAGGFWVVRYAAPQQRLWAWAALALIVLAALYLVYAVFLTRIWFDERGVHFRSPLGGRKSIPFADIADVGWAWWAQCDYIASKRGTRIYVSQMLEGAGELYELIAALQERNAAMRPA
jgi:TPR repeat protein